MLLEKPFEDLSFEDVQELVDKKVPESWILDYKRQFDSKEAAKLISAMANTYGGFVVYGVDSKKDSNEPGEIVGINEDRLDDSVDSLCYDAIDPPVFCQGKYVTNGDGKKVFIVQVPESDLTPHAVDNGTTVYVKVNAQKRPYEKATLERQAWLSNRRKRHIELRDQLVRDSAQRMNGVCGEIANNEVCVETVLIPFYPHKHLRDIKDMDSFLNDVRLQLSKRHPGNIIPHTKRTPYRDGACYYFENENVRYYLDVGTYGLYRSAVIQPKQGEPPKCVGPVSVGHSLQFIVGVGLEMLEHLDCHGSLLGTLSISNIEGTDLWLSPSLESVAIQGEKAVCNLEKHLCVETTFPLGNYWTQKESALVEFFGRLVYLYGAVGDLDAYGRSIVQRTQKSFVRKTLAE